MDFGGNKMPIEVILKSALGRTYFRDSYSGVNGKWYKSHGNNLISWKILIRGIIAEVTLMLVFINLVLSAEHCQDFEKINTGLMKQIVMHGFCSILDIGR